MSKPSSAKKSQTQTQVSELLKHKEIIRIVVNSLTETITSFTRTVVQPGKPVLKSEATRITIAIAGLIRFEGKELSLEFFLGFSKELFFLMYENMFQMTMDEITPENHDLAGEILNIAFGAMDPQFRKLNYHLLSSFPKVYSGKELNDIISKINTQGIVIPYTTADGKSFVAELYTADSIHIEWQFDPGVKRF